MLNTSPAAVAALLPQRSALCGPVTQKRLLRLWFIYVAIFGIGFVLAKVGNAHWQAFGLGLIVPGGGFFAHGDFTSAHGLAHLVAGLIALVAFVVAAGVWFAIGNVIAPPAVWLLTAALAALMDHGVAPHHGAIAVLFGAALVALSFLAFAGGRWVTLSARRSSANRYLQGAAPLDPFPANREAELSERDLTQMRFLLDRALQPADQFNGFEWLDQFQTAAVRYQINFAGYALSMAQATRLSAFGGYLDTAQRNLIDKQTDHRVWRYWAWENAWGNLSLDPDPVARENIMFTGFCALQMAMFHAASGRRDYERAASFTLKHPDGRSFSYDFGSLVAALDREQRRSEFGLIACEPNWIYPLCNAMGASAMKAHEQMHGGGVWSDYAPRFRKKLETEFIDLAGRFVPCRSNYTGLALPNIGGAQPQAMPCFFLNATLPDIAMRQWLLLRRDLLGQKVTFWKIDTGNYRHSRAAAFAGTALAAIELSDDAIAQMCFDALDRECPMQSNGGAGYRPNASVFAHAVEFFARAGGGNGFRNLIENPRSDARGMRLDDAAYPAVLVANATATDGLLRAVLYPGGAPGLQGLGFAGLLPNRRYACDGMEAAEIIADANGEARVNVILNGRTEIRLRVIP